MTCDAFWGVAGRPCEKAAWSQGIFQAAALGAGVEFASVFIDLTKFYEMVGHVAFAQEGLAVGLQPQYLACMAASWGSWRFMQVDGGGFGLFPGVWDHARGLLWGSFRNQGPAAAVA